MGIIGKSMRFKIILSLLFFVGCNDTKNSEKKYEWSHEYISIYGYKYSDTGKPKAMLQQNISRNAYGQATDYYEDIYYYDGRDSLIKIETYSIQKDDTKAISSIEFHTDSSRQYISFREYPNDTSSYSYSSKNANGNIIREYSKFNFISDKDETESEMKYNNRGLLVLSIDTDLTNGVKTIRKYDYKTVNDTLFRTLTENDALAIEWKEYAFNDSIKVSTSKSYMNFQIDTTYIHKKQIREIMYDESTKRIYVVDLDGLGNRIASYNEVWEIVK